MKRVATLLVLALAITLAAPALAAIHSSFLRPAWTKNCTASNRRYPHGVGKLHAHDKTTGRPVMNFWRSTVLYLAGMQTNRGLDRDKDGIACEKH